MKIKKMHLMIAVMSVGHKYGFDSDDHTIEFDKETGMFVIDKYTMIPMQHVKEVILEKPVEEKVEEPITLEDSVHEIVEAPKKTWSRRKKVVSE